MRAISGLLSNETGRSQTVQELGNRFRSQKRGPCSHNAVLHNPIVCLDFEVHVSHSFPSIAPLTIELGASSQERYLGDKNSGGKVPKHNSIRHPFLKVGP